ncbi:MAG: hypothetical protein IKP50_00075 [Bacilli bacterium]|nr:hypothetical protein [Bacilli bacterium]
MLEYFKKLMWEELDGAKEYIKLALEFKATYPEWGKMFVDMSTAELNHATNIYKMAEMSYTETKGAYKEVPEWIDEMWKCIVDKYAHCSAKIKYMHEMYNK